ncbi:MAG TPA: FkbM family methyltransferase [Crinalium sp.]|jgi:FkbM family methyltransferase
MTEPSLTHSLSSPYWDYIHQNCPNLNERLYPNFANEKHDFSDEPTSALELNNYAVMALIEAEREDALELRAMHLELALEALVKGVALHSHPLCVAHLALLRYMLGEMQEAGQTAFSNLVDLVQAVYNSAEHPPLGLIYLPLRWRTSAIARDDLFTALLQAKNGHHQALLLLTAVLCEAQLVFYSGTALRFLKFAVHLFPDARTLYLKLGIASLIQQEWEGLFYLQQARQLAPDHPSFLQSIYLAYRDPEQPEIGRFWLETARQYVQGDRPSPEWKWAELPLDHPITYVPFDQELLLAVEPNVRSIVTSMLLVQGDWFEAEMELWREEVQPGMTVIDVGANVGVYTFSAARRVGPTGRVLAVEPFSGCVRCLQETCKVNELAWVTVCAGAASDRNDTLRLSLRTASELNRVVTDEAEMESGEFEEIPCFTLDSLVEQEHLTQVDWLKIDAEGHELQVLMGSDRLLTQFAPKILYENTAGLSFDEETASSQAVAQFLIDRGYQLYCYRPYLRDLIPINDFALLRGNLNIVALPA